MAGCPILTYHSQLLFGNDYSNNSHIGLREDLQVIAASGRQIIALHELVDALLAGTRALPLDELVCISFDDGPDFDWLDLTHPEHGPQPSFAALLRAHCAVYPEQRPACGTSFVIADPEARASISRQAMGQDWMRDHWWADAQRSGVLSIESHGLDHRHPCLGGEDPAFGHFYAVADEASCYAQIEQANVLIAARSGVHPRIFAYPYGQSSDYLRHEYLPRFERRHGLCAAVSTQPSHVHWDSERWFLPRYVSLQHWHNPGELGRLLRG